jgi:hypothetical protein
VPVGDGRQGIAESGDAAGRAGSAKVGSNGSSKEQSGRLTTETRPEADAEVSTRIEYSHLLQLIKSKDYNTALAKMEVDVEEYGRFLKEAKDSHLTDPFDVLELVIKSKFFDSVKANNKPVSAIYAVLYAGLIEDSREAIHFLLIHTAKEFESLCNAIVSSSLALTSAQIDNTTATNGANNDLVRSDVSGDMAVVTTLAKLFELVDRMMNEYAYVESFGLKRNLLILRCIQPILEKHAMNLMAHWLRTSKFDEYAMIIPSNDWKQYEAFQLAKLENASTASPEESASSNTPSNSSPGVQATQTVPSVRVGGKLEPMRVVTSLDQFSALSQLVETYKAYLHRLYEKGIEEMVAKGHSFVDLGESSHLDHDGLPLIPSPSEREHNIRAFVCEPAQLFMFLHRKSESYKQLETWFLGSALLAAHTPASSTSSKSHHDGILKDVGEPSEASNNESSFRNLAEPPNAASVFAAQKIDQIFSLIMRSLERAIATKQPEVAITLARRAVALCPSFLLSMFLRSIKSSLPKQQIDVNSDIASAILDFHGEPLDISPKQNSSAPTAVAPESSPSHLHSSPSSPSSNANPSASLQSIFSVGLGGLMSFVGNNASSVASGVIVGPKFGVSDEMLVTPPRRVVWEGQNQALICASLNDLALCNNYFPRLYQDIEKKIKYFEKSQANRAAMLEVVGHFKGNLPLLFNVSASIWPLTSAMLPGMAYHVHQFWRTSYEIGEAEYRAMELNDPWAMSAVAWFKSNVEQLKPTLQAAVTEAWLSQLTAQLTAPLQRLIARKRFSAFGALALDAHLRSLSSSLHSLLPTPSSFVVRQHFSILKEITTILSLDHELEILEIWNASHEDPSHFLDPSNHSLPTTSKKVAVKWRLNAHQVKAFMKCRTEWKAAKIDALPLQTP